MRPLITLQKRGKEWAVVMRSGRAVYSSPVYAKAVGVFDYLDMRREEAHLATIRDRERFRAEFDAKTIR